MRSTSGLGTVPVAAPYPTQQQPPPLSPSPTHGGPASATSPTTGNVTPPRAISPPAPISLSRTTSSGMPGAMAGSAEDAAQVIIALRTRISELEGAARVKEEQTAEHTRQARALLADTQSLLDKALAQKQELSVKLEEQRTEAGVEAAKATQRVDDLILKLARARNKEKAETLLRKSEKSEATVREEELRAEIDRLRARAAGGETATESEKDAAVRHLAARTESLQKQLVGAKKETAMLYMRLSTTAAEEAAAASAGAPKTPRAGDPLADELKASRAMAEALKAEISHLSLALQAEAAKVGHIERLLLLRQGDQEPPPALTTPDPEEPVEKSLSALSESITRSTEAVRTAQKRATAMTALVMASAPDVSALATLPEVARPRSGSAQDLPQPRSRSSSSSSAHCGIAAASPAAVAATAKVARIDRETVAMADKKLADAVGHADTVDSLLAQQAGLLRREAEDQKRVQGGANLQFLRNMLVKLLTTDDKKSVWPIISELFGLNQSERDLCASKLQIVQPKKTTK